MSFVHFLLLSLLESEFHLTPKTMSKGLKEQQEQKDETRGKEKDELTDTERYGVGSE